MCPMSVDFSVFLVPPSGSKPAQVAALQKQIKDAEAAATDKDSELARTKKEDIEALQAAQAESAAERSGRRSQSCPSLAKPVYTKKQNK